MFSRIHATFALGWVGLALLSACGRVQEPMQVKPLTRDSVGFVRGMQGELYSAACLRGLADLDKEEIKARMGSCEVSESERRSARGIYTYPGYYYPYYYGWYYDPYAYYYNNWCYYYLGWRWSCDYFWPRYPDTPREPTRCNTACLCGITYHAEVCPAIACSTEQLRACGVYR